MDDLADKLVTLAKLNADGALTDEEFKALKAKLISQSLNNQQRIGTVAGQGSDQTELDHQTSLKRKQIKKSFPDWAAWSLALVPIIPMAAIVANASENLIILYIITMILWLLLYFIDTHMAKKSGGAYPPAIAVVGIIAFAAFTIPMYLYRRSETNGKSLGPFYVSIVIMAGWLFFSSAAPLMPNR